MFRPVKNASQAGFSFIELIIVTAIMVLVFGAIFVSFQFALDLASNTRVKLSALSLANDRMEFFRSLPYDDVGLVASFPAGVIPQTSVFTLNGFEITERIWVDFKDDPADGENGTSVPDSNNIAQDYKQIKTMYTWTLDGRTNSLSLVSIIVPRSIETDVGAGTIRINVLDADNTMRSNATVRIVGSNPAAPYDQTRPTTADGTALFSVPAGDGYQAFVTANIAGIQYSTSSTIVPSPSIPNPTFAPFSVGLAGISTQTFQIGRLSNLTILAKSAIVENSYEELFTDGNRIATSTDTVVSGGQLELDQTLGVFESSGVAYTDTIAPTTLQNWEVVSVAAIIPSGSNYRVQLFTGSTTAYTLIPDTDLPGNGIGFTDTLIDISDLDVTLYPTTTIGVQLETSNTSVTPSITELEIFWRESDTPAANEDLTITGSKVRGTDALLAPIYKTILSGSTNSSGELELVETEFDTYTIETVSGARRAMACPAHPFRLRAGVSDTLELLYVPPALSSVRVTVVDTLGRAIPGAVVQLERGSYDETQLTSTCGQTYFAGGGLIDDVGYELSVSAPGYTTEIVNPFSVTRQTEATITLLP